MKHSGDYDRHIQTDVHLRNTLGFTQEEMLRAGLDKNTATSVGTDNILQEEAFERNSVEQLCKDHLDFLAGMAMPADFTSLFPKGLQAVWQLITEYVYQQNKFPQIALGIPRGHGKTTIIKLFILYCILFTNKRFILVVGPTAQDAENIISDVFLMLSETNIRQTFGDWDLSVPMDTQDLKKFGFRGRNIVVMALGVGGKIRGKNVNNQRPDVMIFDDIQTKECAESEVQSKALETWMIGTAMKAKSPKGCLFIFAGNMYASEYSILKKLKKNPTWIKLISGAILADNTAFWPELRSLDSLLDELDNDMAAGHPGIFFSEVMNDTEVGVNTDVDFSKIKGWQWLDYEVPQGKMIIIDPSGKGVNADLTSIGYVEIYDELPGLKKVIEDRMSPGDTIRQAIILALETGTRFIGVEAVSYQATLLYWFEQVAQQIGLVGFFFMPIHNPAVSKNFRISTMLKGLTSLHPEVVIHPQCRSQVLNQIKDWNPLRRNNNDGILDLLTFIPTCLKEYAALISTEEQVDFEMDGNRENLVEGAYSF